MSVAELYGDISPSIDVVRKIANALDVSIDYLIGKTSMELDTKTLQRLEGIASFPDDKKSLRALTIKIVTDTSQ